MERKLDPNMCKALQNNQLTTLNENEIIRLTENDLTRLNEYDLIRLNEKWHTLGALAVLGHWRMIYNQSPPTLHGRPIEIKNIVVILSNRPVQMKNIAIVLSNLLQLFWWAYPTNTENASIMTKTANQMWAYWPFVAKLPNKIIAIAAAFDNPAPE